MVLKFDVSRQLKMDKKHSIIVDGNGFSLLSRIFLPFFNIESSNFNLAELYLLFFDLDEEKKVQIAEEIQEGKMQLWVLEIEFFFSVLAWFDGIFEFSLQTHFSCVCVFGFFFLG